MFFAGKIEYWYKINCFAEIMLIYI